MHYQPMFRTVCAVLFTAFLSCRSGPDLTSYSVTEDELRRSVEFLASPDLEGRNNGTEGNRKAAEWIARNFREIGLKPAGDGGTYFQSFDTITSGPATNVIGLLEGTGRKDEYIVVAAHHDHLGVRDGRVFRGADDNASGVAVLISLARQLERHYFSLGFVTRADIPRDRSILFVSFDAEEDGMLGSYYFVKSGLYDLKKIKAMICLDLVGGNFFPWETNRVYALGGDHSPVLQDLLEKSAVGGGLDMIQMGIYIIEPIGPVAARSDYSAFRNRGIPFVFFSTGTPWYYHTIHDTPDKLNYTKMLRLCHVLQKYISALSASEESLPFVKDPPLTRHDLMAMKYVLDDAWKHRDQIRLGEDVLNQLNGYRKTLEKLLEQDTPTPADRRFIQQAAIQMLQWVQRIR